MNRLMLILKRGARMIRLLSLRRPIDLKQSRLLGAKLWIAVSLILLAMTTPQARAQETYSPDYCGFEVTFPEVPSSTRKCDGNNQDRCYDLITYTKTFGLDASLQFQIICNRVDEAIYSRYSAEVMEATLKAMTNTDVITAHETNSREEDGYKQSNLIGEGLQGVTPSLYIAQLWIDRQSAFSVEAELLGDAHNEADQLYSDILRSIQKRVIPAASETSLDGGDPEK